MGIAKYNPFSKFFLKGQPDKDTITDLQVINNSQGESEIQTVVNYYNKMDSLEDSGGRMGGAFVSPIHFDQLFHDKKQRIAKYREMSQFPEVNDAIDLVCDDAIVEDEKGDVVKLKIKRELHKSIERQIKQEFNYILNDVFRIERLYDFYRKWLIEGELFLELILDDAKKNIIGIKPLAVWKTYPIYKDGIITSFAQFNQEDDQEQIGYDKDRNREPVLFPRNQIAYSAWNLYGYGKNKTEIKGYLDPAIRTYNQLRSLEDAMVVYRIVRAPERRVWNIEIGKMPAGKAEEYIKKLIHKYKKEVNYNPATGAIDSSANIQSLTEDFWFAQREGSGSRIDSIGGGMNLGELGDIEYILKKLYKVLKMPKDRFQDVSTQYNPGKNLEREEVKFGKFIKRSLDRFKKLFMDTLIQQLKLKGLGTEYLDRSLYDFVFTESNFFKEFKKMEIIESKMNIWSSMSSFVTSPDNPNAPYAAEFVQREWMQMTDEEVELNNKYKEKERKLAEEQAIKQAELNAKIAAKELGDIKEPDIEQNSEPKQIDKKEE